MKFAVVNEYARKVIKCRSLKGAQKLWVAKQKASYEPILELFEIENGKATYNDQMRIWNECGATNWAVRDYTEAVPKTDRLYF